MATIDSSRDISIRDTGRDSTRVASGSNSGSATSRDKPTAYKQREKALESDEFWRTLDVALDADQKNQLQAISSTIWNENMYIPTLQLVLRSFKRPANTILRRVADSSNLRSSEGGMIPDHSKTAESLPMPVEQRITKEPDLPIVLNASMRDLDHRDAYYIMFDPMAKTLAPLLAAMSEHDDCSQLSTRAYSHCIELVAAYGPRYELPTVVVSGKEWRAMLNKVADTEISLLKSLLIGSSENMQGINKIIAVLRCLAGWVVEVYLPWWEEHERIVNDGNK